MADYKKLYYALFNDLTDVCELIEARRFDWAARRIRDIQQAAEERFLAEEEVPPPRLLIFPGGEGTQT